MTFDDDDEEIVLDGPHAERFEKDIWSQFPGVRDTIWEALANESQKRKTDHPDLDPREVELLVLSALAACLSRALALSALHDSSGPEEHIAGAATAVYKDALRMHQKIVEIVDEHSGDRNSSNFSPSSPTAH